VDGFKEIGFPLAVLPINYINPAIEIDISIIVVSELTEFYIPYLQIKSPANNSLLFVKI